MGKRSQKRPKRNEKDHSGCMWGIISIFDFRHGRPTHKLITEARHSSSKQLAVGDQSIVHSKNKFEMLSNLDEDCEGNFDGRGSERTMVKTDAAKPCVKKLIEEEMLINQETMKNVHSVEVESKESRLRLPNPLKMDSKRKKKSRKKSRDMDTQSLKSDSIFESELSHNQHSRHQSKKSLDLDNLMEGFSHFKDACSVVRDHDGEVLAQPNEKDVIAENNVKDAIYEFVNQTINNGKDLPEDEKFVCSQELMQVLQVISSDKELFVRLLQDPNSLLRKHVQELGNAQGTDFKEYSSVTDFNMSKQEPSNLRQTTAEVVNHKQRNLFWKKVMPQEKSPAKGNDNTGSSKRIVIFKPSPMGLPYSETDNNRTSSLDSHDINHPKGYHVRVSSHFSLTEIKKKLKHAMGKDRHGNPKGISKKLSIERPNKEQSSKVFGKDNNGMKSPNKDHFFIEKIARPAYYARKGDKTGKLRDSEVATDLKNEMCLKQRDSNLYTEAKKHLHEILGNGDETMEFSSQQIPETLGRILSLPEYNFSPIGSPRREHEHSFVTAQTRFSTTGNIQEANEDFQAAVLGQPDQATNNPEKQSCTCDESSNEKVKDINLRLNLPADLTHDDEVEGSCCHPVRNEIVPEGLMARRDQKCDSEISDGSRPALCLNQEFSVENQPLFSSPSSSPHSSVTRKVAEMESSSDESERPSPVSVLDTPFDISPANTISETDKVPVQPLHIEFEDHDSSPMNQIEGEKLCTEENKLIFAYIEAVLQSSGLNGDQLRIKYLSSNHILDQSLFDQAGFFPNQLCHDQKLLFDCINEVLVDVCWHYFGTLPWASFLKPSIRPNPDMKKVVLMIWQRVCWHLLPFPRPHTLDQIVQKDMARSETWMDLRGDAETVIIEMGDAILAELMEDTVFSCVSDSLESESSQLQSQLQEAQISTNM